MEGLRGHWSNEQISGYGTALHAREPAVPEQTSRDFRRADEMDEIRHEPTDHSIEERTIMVFLRDRQRDLGTGYKTKGIWRHGRFDASTWREGEKGCDCVRGPLLYGSGVYPCGNSRFLIERIVVWDTGETVHSECDFT
jgi:hypothetical protein